MRTLEVRTLEDAYNTRGRIVTLDLPSVRYTKVRVYAPGVTLAAGPETLAWTKVKTSVSSSDRSGEAGPARTRADDARCDMGEPSRSKRSSAVARRYGDAGARRWRGDAVARSYRALVRSSEMLTTRGATLRRCAGAHLR